jgi:hypothetical protein
MYPAFCVPFTRIEFGKWNLAVGVRLKAVLSHWPLFIGINKYASSYFSEMLESESQRAPMIIVICLVSGDLNTFGKKAIRWAYLTERQPPSAGRANSYCP